MHRNNFDFLRLFAAYLVLWSHEFVVTGVSQPMVFSLRSAGTVGVYIFFGISGYLISRSWIRNPQIGVFFENRIIRIWPAFAAVTILVALVLGPIVTTNQIGNYLRASMTREYLFQLTFDMRYKLPGVFDRNFYPSMASSSTWTIPFELQWYCIVALLGIFRILTNRKLCVLVCFLYVGYVCLRAFYGESQDSANPNELGACFMTGILVSQYRSTLLRFRSAIFVGAVASAGVSGLLQAGILGLLFFVPIAAIAFGEGMHPVLTKVGKQGDFSYGVYLWAWPIQQTVAWYFDNHLAFIPSFFIVSILTLVMAVLSWFLIERPALQWKLRKRRDFLGAPPLSDDARAPL